MPFRSLMRLGGLSAVLSGLLWGALGLSLILQIFIGDVAMTASGMFLAVGRFFELLALVAFFACQYRPLGRGGLAGFALMAAGIVIDLFPPLGPALFWVGLLVFAIANQRVGLLPAWGFWFWLLGASLVLVSAALGGGLILSVGVLLDAAALIWLGTALRQHFSQPEEKPARLS